MIYGVTIPVERTGTYCSSFICQVANSIHTRVFFCLLEYCLFENSYRSFPVSYYYWMAEKKTCSLFSLSLSFGNMIISFVIT